jgi:hypothetical protein
VKWVNDWLPGGDKAVVYVGVHAGLFAAEGLDVEILSGRGSADAITKVASGVGELTAAGIAALMQAKAQGTVPVRAIPFDLHQAARCDLHQRRRRHQIAQRHGGEGDRNRHLLVIQRDLAAGAAAELG